VFATGAFRACRLYLRPAASATQWRAAPCAGGAQRLPGLGALLRREDLRDARLELDSRRQLLRHRGRDCRLQLLDLLQIRGIGEQRQPKLMIEFRDGSSGVAGLVPPLLGQCPNLLALRLREIESPNEQRRTAKNAAAGTATPLAGLGDNRNRDRRCHGDDRDA
jgi:hypothetical protein